MNRVAFEAPSGNSIIIGSNVGSVANRWNSANTEQKCLTGIFGVYEIVEAEEQRLMSIGFYFEEGVDEVEAVEGVEEDEEKGFTAEQIIKIMVIILGVGLVICGLVILYMCIKKPKEIIIEGVTEVINDDNGSIRMKTPRVTSMFAPQPKDNDTMSFNEMGSIAHMFPGTTETMKIEELLTKINMKDKYMIIFKQNGIDTIDDFMELEPDQLENLNLEESDLATILMKIQSVMDEEDARLAIGF